VGKRSWPIAAEQNEANPTWYRDCPGISSGREYFDPLSSTYKPVPVPEGVTSLATIKKAKGVVKKEPWRLGDRSRRWSRRH